MLTRLISRVFPRLSRRSYSHVASSCKFGICFDIDGVLARGYVPIAQAPEAFKLLSRDGQLQVPVAFVTNAMALHQDKARQLSSWLNTNIDPDQVVLCQSPLQCYDDYKRKHCLLIGQGPLKEIAAELGFENTCDIDDVAAAYPLLDVALLSKRNKVAHIEHHEDTDFPRIEAILLLGETGNWESPLQLLIDLMLTHGKPDSDSQRQHKQTLPIIACNKDFQYMHRAKHPRFGNGTFLLCLENIFQKLIGVELQYAALVGKPSELTLRFAEHQLSMQAASIGLVQPIRTLYMVGDNINSDIAAANLYQNYVNYLQQESSLNDSLIIHSNEIPTSRQLPSNHPLLPQTVTKVHSILVRTGVFRDDMDPDLDIDHSHKDFDMDKNPDVTKPTVVVDTVLEAVEYILEQERYYSGTTL